VDCRTTKFTFIFCFYLPTFALPLRKRNSHFIWTHMLRNVHRVGGVTVSSFFFTVKS